MASPQTENGFTKIANEILEEIIKTDFSKRELKIIFAVVRFTYGFNRKEAELSIRYLSTYTGINFQHINKTLTDLQHKNVISFNEPENHSQSRKIKFNKNSINNIYSFRYISYFQVLNITFQVLT